MSAAVKQDAEAQPSSEYDLLNKLAPFLDVHMCLPLVTYLESLNIYQKEELLNVKLEMLHNTNMLDFAMELMTTSPPPEMIQRREDIVQSLFLLKESAGPLLQLLETKVMVESTPASTTEGGETATDAAAAPTEEKEQFLHLQLKEQGNFNMNYLQKNYGITHEILAAFSQYGKFQFECGNYEETASYMSIYCDLDPGSDLAFNALWGKLASEILMMQWDENAVFDALADLQGLQAMIDAREAPAGPRDGIARPVNHLEQLQLRSWILHWSLFVFFNHPEGRHLLVDFFLQPKYLSAIQINCPHLLRYLAVACVVNKSKRMIIRDVVRVIEQERSTFRDPITDFLSSLYSKFDFEAALEKLSECESVLKTDYFLLQLRDEFMEVARQYAFEMYARVHTAIDTNLLSSKLRMPAADAERWIVNLIRNSKKIDAKIDSEHNQVIMARPQMDIYQQVIDSTKDLAFRTYQLASNITTMQNEGTMQ